MKICSTCDERWLNDHPIDAAHYVKTWRVKHIVVNNGRYSLCYKWPKNHGAIPGRVVGMYYKPLWILATFLFAWYFLSGVWMWLWLSVACVILAQVIHFLYPLQARFWR